jgi:hypothetical protein
MDRLAPVVGKWLARQGLHHNGRVQVHAFKRYLARVVYNPQAQVTDAQVREALRSLWQAGYNTPELRNGVMVFEPVRLFCQSFRFMEIYDGVYKGANNMKSID